MQSSHGFNHIRFIIHVVVYCLQVHAHSGIMVQIVKKCPNATAQIHFHLTTMTFATAREIGMVNDVIVRRHKMTHVLEKERSVGETSAHAKMDIPEPERAVEVHVEVVYSHK